MVKTALTVILNSKKMTFQMNLLNPRSLESIRDFFTI